MKAALFHHMELQSQWKQKYHPCDADERRVRDNKSEVGKTI